MKDAKDLRIGNWYNNQGTHEQVTLSVIEALFESSSRLWIKPIELTKDRLERCGCKIRERISERWAFLEGYYDVPVICDASLVLGFENGKCYLYHYLESFMGNSIDQLCELNYLHELQNAIYALTKQELEYKP